MDNGGVREQLIMSYVREHATDAAHCDTERVGPFVASFDRGTASVHLNYAIPDDGAEPTVGDIEALVQVFTRRGLTPALEFLPGVAPSAERQLLEYGFIETARLPLMTADGGEIVDLSTPAGVILEPPADARALAEMVRVQHDVFGDEDPPEAQIERLRAGLAAGVTAIAAVDSGTGATVGAGQTSTPGSIVEIVGVAVLPGYRRRGIAGAIVSRLAREALGRGLPLVSIEAEVGADGAYRRAGFRPTSSVVHLALQPAS